MKQTIKYKLNPNKEQEKHLHNLSSIATKLYNTDNYIRRATWKKCGKIPSWYSQKKNNIKSIVAGDLTDIRKDNNFGKRNNQKLHSWSFSKLIQQIEYKSILSGIRFVRVSEENTSKTCSICGTMRKSNRIKRGLYRCKICSNYINSDVNGAKNILKKYLQFFSNEDRSIGNVAMPLVSRIENVIPR